MKGLLFKIIFLMLLTSNFAEAKSNLEQFYHDGNWTVLKSSAEVDPFTKKRGPSYCQIVDKRSEFTIYTISSGQIVVVNYTPSNYKTIIQDHFSDLKLSKSSLYGASEGDYGKAGIFSHIKLTHSSTKGIIYTEKDDSSNKHTPENYPARFEQNETLFPNEKGDKYSLSNLCTYNISTTGLPIISNCNSVQFMLPLETIQKIEDEAKAFENYEYILRMQTFTSVFAEQQRNFFPSYYLKRKSYDFLINVFGLTTSINKLNACKSSLTS